MRPTKHALMNATPGSTANDELTARKNFESPSIPRDAARLQGQINAYKIGAGSDTASTYNKSSSVTVGNVHVHTTSGTMEGTGTDLGNAMNRSFMVDQSNGGPS